MSYITVRYIGNTDYYNEWFLRMLLIIKGYFYLCFFYIILTPFNLLLTSIDNPYLGVLLILSGRQGAGGFSITCNAIKEDTSY